MSCIFPIASTFKCGEVTSVRLVRDYGGKSKGFGYIEFSSTSCVPTALELDRRPMTAPGAIVPRPMYVSVCNTNRSRGAQSGRPSRTTGPEPKKLFVRNLDKQVREDALKTFFGKVLPFVFTFWARKLHCVTVCSL